MGSKPKLKPTKRGTKRYHTKNKFKSKQQRTSQNHTCRRGLLAPRSFIMFASVVLLNVSVSSNKRSTNQGFRTKTLITFCRDLHLNCLHSAVVWLRIFTCKETPIRDSEGICVELYYRYGIYWVGFKATIRRGNS